MISDTPPSGITKRESKTTTVDGIIIDALFEVKDHDEKTVYCDKIAWEQHIVGNKRWMDKYFDEVKVAVTNPNVVTGDKDFEDRECFYRICGDGYMKVVVEKKNKKESVVITAYRCNSIKSEEKRLWIRKN